MARIGRRWVVRGQCSPSTTSPIRDTSDRRRRRSPGWKTARAACWRVGIAFADAVNTVSRSYLEEILTVEHGMGMDGLLRSRMGDLYGILNGVDYEEFAPESDPY